MAYYTERHTMREPVKKTYDISVDVYTLIFQCCEKYYNNLAWKYPDQCPDGYGCCGLDLEKLNLDLKYEIPTLFRDDSARIGIPSIHSNIFSNDVIQDEYDQFALLDYVEFFADNVRDVEIGDYHKYFGHHHLIYKDSRAIVLDFKQEINKIFQRTGVLYCLNADLQVERVIEGSPLTTELENTVTSVKEPAIDKEITETPSIASDIFFIILSYKVIPPFSSSLPTTELFRRQSYIQRETCCACSASPAPLSRGKYLELLIQDTVAGALRQGAICLKVIVEVLKCLTSGTCVDFDKLYAVSLHCINVDGQRFFRQRFDI